eukprot:gene20044-22011_t
MNLQLSPKIIIILIILAVNFNQYSGDLADSKSKNSATEKSMSVSKSPQQGHSHHLYQRYYKDDLNWFQSLIWNLIGYSTVLVPIFLLVRMVKYSNFYEKDGNGRLFKAVEFCVFGSETDEQRNLESGKLQESAPKQQELSNRQFAIRLAFCAVGLQITYLTWGVLQERVMTKKYGTGTNAEKFRESEFLVFINRISAMTVAFVCMLVKRQGKHRAPFYKYLFSSFSNILSSWCQYEALKFVSFPTQVLGKASKMIPVMLMGRIVSRKSYQYYEYFTAGMISVGVSLFLLSVASGKNTSSQTNLAGLFLMVGYMGFDSFTSNWQSKLFVQYKLTSLQVMFGANVFSSLFTGVSLFLNGGMIAGFSFMYYHPEFAYHASLISMASAIGQLFIFYTIGMFGPLVFTCIMVTRQMFSILLSCIVYQHTLAPQAILGVLIVFMALFLQIYAKWRTKAIQKRQAAGQQPRV